MRIYLCGPINACSDAEAKDWRKECTDYLVAAGHEVLDPMSRDFRGKEAESTQEIVEGDKRDIDNCGVILVYYWKPSVGTSMEVLYAWETNTTVVLVDASNAPLSPWLLYHSAYICKSLPEALTYITTNTNAA